MSNSSKTMRKVLVMLLSIMVAIAMGQFLSQSNTYAATNGGGGGQSGYTQGGNNGPGGNGGPGHFGPGGNSSNEQVSDDDEDVDEDEAVDEDADEDEDVNGADLTIAEDPEDATYAVGNYADEMSIELDGDDSDVTYQWYSNTKDSNEDGTAIVGATDPELDGDYISTAAEGTTYFYCVVTEDNGDTLISDTAKVTVKALAITTQPKSGTYKVGKSVNLTVKFVGNGDVQWFSSSDGETWTEIEDADSAKLKASTAAEGTTYYRAVVTNGLDSDEEGFVSVTSSTAKIVVSGTTKTVVGKFAYKITSDTEATVVGVAKKTYTSLVIPSTVTIGETTYKVTAIGAGAFKNCLKLRTVTVGENVTTIGENAFKGDNRLSTVKFSGSAVTTIGKNAFRGLAHNIKFSIPTAQLSAYQTLIEAAGAPNNAKYIAF